MTKIGIDIHGVLDTHTEVFKSIMLALTHIKYEVHIITGIPFKHVKDTLEEMCIIKDVHYTHFFSIEEHLISEGVQPIGKNKKGRNIYDNHTWDVVKANYCYKHDIGLMIDDSEEYQKYFITPFALLK